MWRVFIDIKGWLWWAYPPKQSSKPPTNWDMKHYKSVEFLSNLNVKPPLHRRKAPPSHKRKVPLFTTFWRRFCIKAVGKLQAWNENSKFLRRRQETFLTPSSCAIRGWSAGAEPGGFQGGQLPPKILPGPPKIFQVSFWKSCTDHWQLPLMQNWPLQWPPKWKCLSPPLVKRICEWETLCFQKHLLFLER